MRDTRHGSFASLLGTTVHSHDWWLGVARNVSLDGDATEFVRVEGEGQFGDSAWVLTHMPIGLNYIPPSDTVDLVLGFVASRVEAGVSVEYPFLWEACGGRSALLFSSQGPEPPIRDSIASAFWARLAGVRRA